MLYLMFIEALRSLNTSYTSMVYVPVFLEDLEVGHKVR